MIIIKTDEKIQNIKEGGKILAEILNKIIQEVRSGISTAYLNNMAIDLIKQAGGRPSFLNYQPFKDTIPYPAALCTSINDELVHGIPSEDRILQNGDIISLDIGMEYKGGFTDMAKTVAVGKVGKDTKKLIKTTRTALEKAIQAVRPGNSVQDIGRAIEGYIKGKGYSIVRDLVGHGVGTKVWEEPQVPNYVAPGTENIIFKPGMVIAIEPMINIGSHEVKTLDDDWTISTLDGSLCAHFEHTIIITENGNEIATI